MLARDCTWAPCRVLYVVDEPDWKGFAYGTPECGEESFIVSLDEDETIHFNVTGLIQRRVTWRYLDAVHP